MKKMSSEAADSINMIEASGENIDLHKNTDCHSDDDGCKWLNYELENCNRETADSVDSEVQSDRVFSTDLSPDIENSHLQLSELNEDVIFYIALFLDASDIHNSLSKVCKRFKEIFDNQAYWKARLFKNCPKQFPAVPCREPAEYCWEKACVSRETSTRVWSNWETHTEHFIYRHNLHGEVDTVHLMNEGRLLISGDRNRVLNFVDLSRWQPVMTDNQERMLSHSDISHGGWIWCMASVGHQLVTGSWDTKIRVFDVNAGCPVIQQRKCSSAVLSLHAEENELVASCYKEVIFFDMRSNNQKVITPHVRPVLCVVGDDRYIITGSEDKSICVHDRRANKILQRQKLDSYPIVMSYYDNQLWFGDRKGHIHLLDGSEGNFNEVGVYDISHTDKLTGLVASQGAVFSCSGDKTIKVSQPTREPSCLATMSVHSKEVAGIAFNSGVLASAGGDESVAVWLPKGWASMHSY